MAESYGKFIQAIDNFENYSQNIISQCEDFIQLSTMVGEKIGSGVEFISKAAFDTVKNDEDTGALTKLGLGIAATASKSLFTAAGAAFGEWRKNSKYKKAQKKILEDGLNYKQTAFQLIPKSLEVCGIYLEACVAKVRLLQEKILAGNYDDKFLEEAANDLHDCIQMYYQVEYKNELAQNIVKYFNEFENRLDDLEEFSHWYVGSILVNKIECYKTSYEAVQELICENINDDEILTNIKNTFEIENAISPVLVIEDVIGNSEIWREIYNKIYAEKKHKIFYKRFPDFFYETKGFNELYDIVNNSFENIILPKFKKTCALVLTLPVLILTGIYTILYFTGVFSFQKFITFNYPKYLDIGGVFLITELICLIIVLIKRHKIFTCDGIIQGQYIASQVVELTEKYAETEKELRKDELDERLLPKNETAGLISDNGKEVSEEDFLASIINN